MRGREADDHGNRDAGGEEDLEDSAEHGVLETRDEEEATGAEQQGNREALGEEGHGTLRVRVVDLDRRGSALVHGVRDALFPLLYTE